MHSGRVGKQAGRGNREGIEHLAVSSLSLPALSPLLVCFAFTARGEGAANPVEKMTRKTLQRKRFTDYVMFFV